MLEKIEYECDSIHTDINQKMSVLVWLRVFLICGFVVPILFLLSMVLVGPEHKALYETLLICSIGIFTTSFICYVMTSFYDQDDIITSEEV